MKSTITAVGLVLLGVAAWAAIPVLGILLGTGLAVYVLSEMIGGWEEEKAKIESKKKKKKKKKNIQSF